jgi:hypothetical protein
MRNKFTDEEKELIKSLRTKINYHRVDGNFTKLSDSEIIEMYYMFKGNLDQTNPNFKASGWYFSQLIGGSERILRMEE